MEINLLKIALRFYEMLYKFFYTNHSTIINRKSRRSLIRESHARDHLKFTGSEPYLTLFSALLEIVSGPDFRIWNSGEPAICIKGFLNVRRKPLFWVGKVRCIRDKQSRDLISEIRVSQCDMTPH